jgi:hypothetical protein
MQQLLKFSISSHEAQMTRVRHEHDLNIIEKVHRNKIKEPGNHHFMFPWQINVPAMVLSS